jgi:hypothetical protein
MTTPTQGEHAQPEALRGAPPSAYSQEDHAFYTFWYGHMLNELMQPPLAGVSHSTARYIWDAAIAHVAAQPAAPQGGAYVENPAEIEHVAGDVSKNRAESNMTGGAYAPMQGLSAYLRAEAVGVQGVAAETLRQWAAEVDVASAHALRASHGQAPAGVAELAEADRRAGAAERELASCKEDVARLERVRDQMKDQWGVSRNVSFDVVWAEALALKAAAQPAPAATPQADSQPAPDERDDFEKVFPLPFGCIRVGTGYASTGYSNWAAHTHVERWKGWQARAARAPADSVTAPAAGAVAELDPVGMVPVAEVVECEKMGQQALREIDGRWRWLSIGERLYARADTGIATAPTPAAQGDAVLRNALQLAVDHIDMDALSISHCKDAEAIRAALAQKEFPHGN